MNLMGTPIRSAQPLLMHQTRSVGRDDIFGPSSRVIADLVISHLRGHDFFEHRKRAAEATAFVRPRRLHELDTLDLGQKVNRLRKERLAKFGRTCELQPAK